MNQTTLGVWHFKNVSGHFFTNYTYSMDRQVGFAGIPQESPRNPYPPLLPKSWVNPGISYNLGGIPRAMGRDSCH